MTDQSIRKKMNKIDTVGHLVQWAIELGQFNIKYRPRVAIKAQVLDDFIVEFTYPQEEKEPQKETWTVQIDRSTTKKAEGVGAVLISLEGEILKYAVRLQFPATNNETGYETLLTRLSLARVLKAKTLIIQANSQLVVGQEKGDDDAKEERMQKYLKIAKKLLQHFDNAKFKQIPHKKNTKADFLARLASSDEHGISPELCMEKKG